MVDLEKLIQSLHCLKYNNQPSFKAQYFDRKNYWKNQKQDVQFCLVTILPKQMHFYFRDY